MMDYERIGTFYLGKRFDHTENRVADDLLLYDAKDMTTHAVCVGMTGSGKTGLCVSLLEEAAIDGIPALIIDPKGDLGNLMLTFPQLRPEDFAPWVDAGAAARKGRTPGEYAADTATLWRKGLADWHQAPERIARLRDTVDIAIYTPGSEAGLQLNLLKSFAAPPAELRSDSDAMRDRIQATVSGLLALLGLQADPLKSREHILLSNILNHTWQSGNSLDLAGLIQAIQKPPFQKLGVFDLPSFFPADDRFALALQLNNLLASPGFATWMAGEPLDVQRLLWTPEGKPRLTILSIAHLSDSERMFFVTLLLNEVIAWMRTQPGTASLRALLYMDEIFGYFPPTANPPAKAPMLTLLKQARAFGLGVVLATQNPVDLDYKGLSNTGTWFIGRLQTERDKMRVLDGLEGAAGTGTFDRQAMEAIISGLRNRVFLLNNVHEDGPVLFQTRWAMSYLRGPLTRSQISTLMQQRRQRPTVPEPAPPAPEKADVQAAIPANGTAATPAPAGVLPAGVVPRYLVPTREPGASDQVLYRPLLLACLRLHFANARTRVDQWQDRFLLLPFPEAQDNPSWQDAAGMPEPFPKLVKRPLPGARHGRLPDSACVAGNYKTWERQLKTHAYQNESVTVWQCPLLKLTSAAGTAEGDFKAEVATVAREQRDLAVEKLRAKYAPRLKALAERVRKAEATIAKEKQQFGQQALSAALSFGATLAGALFGRKLASVGTISRTGTAIRRAGRTSKEKGDIGRAQAAHAALVDQLAAMNTSLEQEIEAIRTRYQPQALALKPLVVRPRKTDTTIALLTLTWTPWSVDRDGVAERLF